MKDRKFKILLIVVLSILVLIFTIFFIYLLTGNTFNYKRAILSVNNISNNIVFKEEYDHIFDSIIIKSNNSVIEIEESINNKIKLDIYGDKDEISVNDQDNILNIVTEVKPCKMFCVNNKSSKIILYLPKDYSGKLDLSLNYGNINIDEFNNAVLNAKIDAGNIEIDALESAKIKSSYGNIEIERIDRVIIDSDYGDIDIEEVNEFLDIKEDFGDIEIERVYLKENSTISNSYGDIKIGNTNEIFINAKTSLGTTKINHNYDNSNVLLKIDNSCGNIKINN